jgi:hypothetical protein
LRLANAPVGVGAGADADEGGDEDGGDGKSGEQNGVHGVVLLERGHEGAALIPKLGLWVCVISAGGCEI